jgi:hypothetical protein
MSINIHTNISKADHIEIEKNSDDHITVWITHEGELHGIWLRDISPEFEIVLNGVQVGRQPQPKKKGHGFSDSTMEKAVTLLRQGSFTRRQIGSFIGLTDNSVSTLLSDLGKDFTLTKIGKINKLYSIAS